MNDVMMTMADNDGDKKMPASSVYHPSMNVHSSQQQTKQRQQLDFTNIVERIVSALEQRGENHNPHHGPLTRDEISKLSLLCTQQTMMYDQKRTTTTTTTIASSSMTGNVINNDLGFADVDVDMMSQLVEYLEKHVALASSIDLIQSSYKVIQIFESGESVITSSNNNNINTEYHNFEEWLKHSGAELVEIVATGLEAASILLCIMTSPGIDRRVVNDDAIVASMVLMRHHLEKNILPALNHTGHIIGSMNKKQILASPQSKKRRRSSVNAGETAVIRGMTTLYPSILRTIGKTVILMESLDLLIRRIPLDDQHVITLSGGALVTLELDPSNLTTEKYSLQLHVSTIAIVTSIFRKYPKLRSLVIEDLFALMLHMPTGKRSMRTFPVQCSSILYPHNVAMLSQLLVGGSTSNSFGTKMVIQPISVLLMNLIQSVVVRPVFQEQGEGVHNENSTEQGQYLRLQTGLGASQAISELFVKHLMHRCSKKGEDGGASEFRPILSNLIDDLILLLLVPEYPAAEMVLLSIVNAISRDLMQISKKKSGKEIAETTYLNTIFDAFGRICAAEARIRSWNEDHPVQEVPPEKSREKQSQIRHFDCYCKETDSSGKYILNCDRCKTWYHGDCMGITREAPPEKWLCDGCQVGRIVEFERDHNTNLGELGCSAELIDRPYCMRRLLIDYLSFALRRSGQASVRNAYEFHLARWLNELDSANCKAFDDNENDNEVVSIKNNLSLMAGLLDMWNPSDSHCTNHGSGAGSLSGMLQCLSDEGRSRIVVDLMCKLSGLLKSFQSQVGFIVKLLSSDIKSIRKLSLKAIEKVADADPRLMLYSIIKKAVKERFTDESISVREAVVSLVGSYVIRSPGVANAFHQAFLIGLADPGLSVRKRTVSVLQDILCNIPSYEGRAEACSAMLRLAANPKEDDTVRDLIHDLFTKIWLENGNDVVRTQELSPRADDTGDNSVTPVSRVSNVEYLDDEGTPEGVQTPASNIPNNWSTTSKRTRSTAKKLQNRNLQIRCEVAAEQMVEVVKAANSGEDLTLLFRDLLSGVADSDKIRKSHARKKRQELAKMQSGMLIDALFEMLLAVEESTEMRIVEKGRDFVAIFKVIRVFTDVSPGGISGHIDTLLPYLKADNGFHRFHEEEIARSLCEVLSRVVSELDQQDIEKLGDTSLADDLVGISKKMGPHAAASAVQTMCLLAAHKHSGGVEIFATKLLALAQTFYAYLVRYRDSEDCIAKRGVRSNVKRTLEVMGSICKHYDLSSFTAVGVESETKGDEPNDTELTLLNVAPLCEHLFMQYLEKNDVQTTCSALRALSGVFMAHPREMLRMDQSGLITNVMESSSADAVQLEALRCWRDILLAEESRVESGEAKAKMDSKKNITVSKRISGDQDADATLFGGILTNHASRLYEMTMSRNEQIRFAAVDLIGHLLRQGQLNPNEATPHLLAVQGDVEENIRSEALKLLMLEGEKRPDMLRQRLCAGIKQAYLFQKAVHPELREVSALINARRESASEKECVFGGVYKECIATIKKQRRGLFRNLLNTFDPDNRKNGKSTADMDLELLSYTSQVLAYLPYGVPSDPLYIIHHLSSTIALHGNTLLDRFASFLRPYGLASSDEFDEVNAEEDDLESAAKRHLPHHAKEVTALLSPSFDMMKFAELCMDAGCLILLLRLKGFLRQLYNLSESRCIGFNPDSKEVGEKPITKSSTSSVFQSKLPMQGMNRGRGNEFLDAMIFQYAEFRVLMRSEIGDASIVEMSDDDEGEGMADPHSASKAKRRRSSMES